MNVSWRFLLNPENKIYFVAIDLLASAQELLNFGSLGCFVFKQSCDKECEAT